MGLTVCVTDLLVDGLLLDDGSVDWIGVFFGRSGVYV